MKTKIISLIQIIILILVIVGLSTILSPCSGDKVMKCNHSVNVVKLLFGTGILVKVIELFVKEQGSIYLDIFSILLYVDSTLVPALVVGGCGMADMTCRAAAFPGIYITSILLIVVNSVSVLSILWKKRGNVAS